MLRVAARRLSSFCSTQPSWRPNQAASAIVSRNPTNGGEYFHLSHRGGHSLLGGLGNNFSGLLDSSHQMTCSFFMSQQHRTFIQMRTVLKVVDNSGAKKVMCIQALKGKKGARLGDTIVASVKEAMPNGKVKKGKVVYGVVVRAAMQRGRCDGSEVKFDDNAVVLVDKQGQPIGTRVFGPVPHELRKKKHVKILTLAEHIA
ncbi:50S ribosomal protein HLP, mitochondrial isoform X1 [Hevea brasiliensis]|uniref:50S ribosomal protein HLP, mitochondrial isoform X1 n=1 Tax=Hevea brasiliensis TaxID=3981 RepID=UPI0025F6B5D0|nr:50S ribosomal protein HLP, mitochondrial isoform X1 [Hevea brasiliensis]